MLSVTTNVFLPRKTYAIHGLFILFCHGAQRLEPLIPSCFVPLVFPRLCAHFVVPCLENLFLGTYPPYILISMDLFKTGPSPPDYVTHPRWLVHQRHLRGPIMPNSLQPTPSPPPR